MDKNNSLRKAFYHLKMSGDYFEDVLRESPNTLAGKLSSIYTRRIKWILNDFNANPSLPKYAAEDFKNDINGDLMFFESISQKCLQLSESQKESLESLIDELLKGEEINVVVK